MNQVCQVSVQRFIRHADWFHWGLDLHCGGIDKVFFPVSVFCCCISCSFWLSAADFRRKKWESRRNCSGRCNRTVKMEENVFPVAVFGQPGRIFVFCSRLLALSAAVFPAAGSSNLQFLPQETGFSVMQAAIVLHFCCGRLEFRYKMRRRGERSFYCLES